MRDEYMKELERVKNEAEEGLNEVIESSRQLIDLPFKAFTEQLEGKNIGTLKAYRALIHRNLDEADSTAAAIIKSRDGKAMSGKELTQLGSVFGLISKIIERIGYIDLLIKDNSIK